MASKQIHQAAPSLMVNLRVLVLDDDPWARAELRACLLGLGITRISDGAVSDESGELRGYISRIDLVLSEVMFRSGHGLSVLRAIREGRVGKIAPETSFVFVTRTADIQTTSAAAALKVDGMLIKPVTQDRLRPVLVRATKKQPSSAPHGAAATLISPLQAHSKQLH